MAQGTKNSKELLTVQEAAVWLKRTPPALYKAIRNGHLPTQTVLGRIGIRLADLEEYQRRTQSVGAKGGRPRNPPDNLALKL